MKYVDKKVHGWRKEKVRFGIIGRSALGKSTFINTLLQYDAGDSSAAEVGRGNTTMGIVEYPHSKHPDLTIVDTPGFGTRQMNRKKFLQMVDLKTFDYILVFIDTVFEEHDLWIAEQIKMAKVPFCFVRNKIDMDVEMGIENGMTKEEAIASVRRKLNKEKEEEIELLKDVNIYLISNKPHMWILGDWSALVEDISKTLSDSKLYVLMSFLPVLTLDVVEKKYKEFQGRLKWVSFGAAVLAAIPLPGIDRPINTKIVLDEMKDYRRTFGLNEEYATALKQEPEEELKIKIKEKVSSIGSYIPMIPFTRTFLFAYETRYVVKDLLSEELLKCKTMATDLYRKVHC